MTEQDLLEYARCEREIAKLHSRYKEEEARMCCPRSPSIDGSPRGSGTDDPFLDILDRRKKLKERLSRLAEDRVMAERRLDRAYAVLDSDVERDLFECLYREGLRIEDAAKKIRYSTSYTYHVRSVILERISPLPN